MPLFAKKPPANGEPDAAAPTPGADPAGAVAAAAAAAAAPPPPPTAVLTMPDGQEILLPVLTDAAGARFLDVRRLQPATGICTFDPGFGSTGEFSCVLGQPVEAENVLETNQPTDQPTNQPTAH